MSLPYVVEGDLDGPDLRTVVEKDDGRFRRLLLEHGAILFRGFPVDGVDGFESVVRAFSGDPLPYSEQSSPRSSIRGNVYTSTDYPPEEEIFLHNESSYQSAWPSLVYFFCVRPPETQGATPLADVRQVHEAIDPLVREEFAERGWMVVRNFRENFGVGWRQAFGTDDRDAVTEYCRSRDIDCEWLDDEHLRTRAKRKAIHVHPETGERVWFNHATFFHYTTLSADLQEGLLGLFGEEGLPTNTYYADGGRIPDEVIAHLRACYRTHTTRFDWAEHDVLMVDNMLAAHGREPFTGPRRIAVAMAEPRVPAERA